MNSRPKKQKPEAAPTWLTSYGDLMTNLVCCFVLLYSIAIIDMQKFDAVASSLRAAFSNKSISAFEEEKKDSIINLLPDVSTGKQDEDKSDDIDGEKPVEGSEKMTVEKAKVEIEKIIEGMGLTENVKVIEEKDIVIFRVDSLILFDSGKADLKESGKPVIEKIGLVLKELNISVLVQGHADDRPINTLIFPSNWELSTKRATNVVRYLMDKCGIDGKYLTATGNAEYQPIAPNDSEYNRQKNRRIDIVIAKD